MRTMYASLTLRYKDSQNKMYAVFLHKWKTKYDRRIFQDY